MLRGAVLAGVLVIVGCYHPSYRDCAIACSADCPGDLTCDTTLHMCRLPGRTGACETGDGDGGVADSAIDGPFDPGGDSDGDGVTNGSDNCPTTANNDQADEDSDMIGDPCDPCPIDRDTTDSDGDGLPDACDPHPTKNGTHVIVDRIVRFEAFNGTFGNGATSHGGASISASSGVALIFASSGEGYLTYPIAPGTNGVTVFTRMTYSFMPSQLHGGGPITEIRGYDPNDRAQGFGCEIESPPSGQTGGELDLFETDNQSYNGSIPISTAPIPGPLPVSVGADSPTALKLTCRHANDLLMGDGAPVGTFDVGIYAHSASASFDYLLVVESGS